MATLTNDIALGFQRIHITLHSGNLHGITAEKFVPSCKDFLKLLKNLHSIDPVRVDPSGRLSPRLITIYAQAVEITELAINIFHKYIQPIIHANLPYQVVFDPHNSVNIIKTLFYTVEEQINRHKIESLQVQMAALRLLLKGNFRTAMTTVVPPSHFTLLNLAAPISSSVAAPNSPQSSFLRTPRRKIRRSGRTTSSQPQSEMGHCMATSSTLPSSETMSPAPSTSSTIQESQVPRQGPLTMLPSTSDSQCNPPEIYRPHKARSLRNVGSTTMPYISRFHSSDRNPNVGSSLGIRRPASASSAIAKNIKHMSESPRHMNEVARASMPPLTETPDVFTPAESTQEFVASTLASPESAAADSTMMPSPSDLRITQQYPEVSSYPDSSPFHNAFNNVNLQEDGSDATSGLQFHSSRRFLTVPPAISGVARTTPILSTQSAHSTPTTGSGPTLTVPDERTISTKRLTRSLDSSEWSGTIGTAEITHDAGSRTRMLSVIAAVMKKGQM